jgi:hypothetical protein
MLLFCSLHGIIYTKGTGSLTLVAGILLNINISEGGEFSCYFCYLS